MDVTLTLWEWMHAVHTALLRMATGQSQGLDHASTYQRTWGKRLEEEVVGVCGEIAVAKVLGRYWLGTINTFHRQPDVSGYEVRATALPDGCLIVRDNDADDRFFVLVIGEPPCMRVVGYMRGSEAKQPEWKKNPHGHRESWFIPQSRLHPLPMQRAA